MTTNSTFGWPIITKEDMFKPTTISQLQGAAFDNRVTLERQRYETRVASTSALPATGTYIGQQIWVTGRNRPYYWTGSSWKAANGFEAGNILIKPVSWTGSAFPLLWSGVINIALPAGRFTAVPNIVVNAYMDNRVIWGTPAAWPSTTTIKMRFVAIAPGAPNVHVFWAAFDSN